MATIMLDPASGELTAEGLDEDGVRLLQMLLGSEAQAVNCASPVARTVPLERAKTGHRGGASAAGDDIRVHAIWHRSVVDGPGVRSVLQVQGCPLQCAGCYVPQTHDSQGGVAMGVEETLAALLDPAHQRDGVTLVGGEPTAQAAALLPLVRRLVARGVHVLLYTGYTVEALGRRGDDDVRELLSLVDQVCDGPFVRRLKKGAGQYQGSRNQRLLSREQVAGLLAPRRIA